MLKMTLIEKLRVAAAGKRLVAKYTNYFTDKLALEREAELFDDAAEALEWEYAKVHALLEAQARQASTIKSLQGIKCHE